MLLEARQFGRDDNMAHSGSCRDGEGNRRDPKRTQERFLSARPDAPENGGKEKSRPLRSEWRVIRTGVECEKGGGYLCGGMGG